MNPAKSQPYGLTPDQGRLNRIRAAQAFRPAGSRSFPTPCSAHKFAGMLTGVCVTLLEA